MAATAVAPHKLEQFVAKMNKYNKIYYEISFCTVRDAGGAIMLRSNHIVAYSSLFAWRKLK
jgi:hypothetical protein